MRVTPIATLCAAVVMALASACGGSSSTPTAPSPPPPITGPPPPGGPPGTDPTPGPPPPGMPPPNTGGGSPTGQTVVVTAVGDTGECGAPGVAQVARLAERLDGPLLLAGDLAYFQGSIEDFVRCFDPAWGQLRRRWRPVPGNHEYQTPGAAGYFQYFGEAGSHAGRSYYSFRAGDWLMLMLDSNIGVDMRSAQYQFVRAELQANRSPCAMAVWHYPLFTSGPNGPNVRMRDMWGLLYEHNADVVINGHDHLYERFGKQDVDGRSDVRGLRQFIAGTGGATLYDFMRLEPNSQQRISRHGVLRVTLNPSSYDWAFIDTTGATLDAGSDGCH